MTANMDAIKTKITFLGLHSFSDIRDTIPLVGITRGCCLEKELLVVVVAAAVVAIMVDGGTNMLPGRTSPIPLVLSLSSTAAAEEF